MTMTFASLRFLAASGEEGSFLIHRPAPWHVLGLNQLHLHSTDQSQSKAISCSCRPPGWMDVCEMLEGLALKEAQPALYSSSIMFDFDEVGEGSSTRRMDGWVAMEDV